MMDADNESSILSALLSLKHGRNFTEGNSMNDQCDNYTTISGHSDEVVLMEPVGANTSNLSQKPKKVKKRKLPNGDTIEGEHQQLKSFKSGNLHIKLMRGRYKCSLCGAFKTNHVCALVPDKLMCSVGVQSGPHSQETYDAVLHSVVSCDEDATVSTKMTSSMAAMSCSLDSMDGATTSTHPPAILTSSNSNSNISGSNSKISPADLMSDTVESMFDKVYSEGIKPECTGNEGSHPSSPPLIATSAGALQPPLLSLISTHGIFKERIITVSRNRPSIQDTTTTPPSPTTAAATADASSKNIASKEENDVVGKQPHCSTEQQQPPVLLSAMVSGLVPSDQDARLDAAMTAAAQTLKLSHNLPSAFLYPPPAPVASPSTLLPPKMLMKQEYTKHHLVEQEGEYDAAQSSLLLTSDSQDSCGKEEKFHGRAVSIADCDINSTSESCRATAAKGSFKHHHPTKTMPMQQKQHQQLQHIKATAQGASLL